MEMSGVTIETKKREDLVDFLQYANFQVEKLGDNVFRATRESELPVYLKVLDKSIYFEIDLGNISSIADTKLYFELLDMNTEILPVSFGINNTNHEDPRLVVVESRELNDLCDQELLSVFDALELAVDKAETVLSKKIN
jgi:hypothetical protein